LPIRQRHPVPERRHECAVERAFRLITEGKDVLDALIAGVNIPELDPEETGIGYGALPNAEGVVQLDASCMHGPRRAAGGVAAIEGVRTPSLVAQAVMDQTDHHLLAGKGAQDFARALGFTIEAISTPSSRAPVARVASPHGSRALARSVEAGFREKDKHEKDPGETDLSSMSRRDAGRRALEAGWSMVTDGLIPEGTFWGTINCNGINANGDICGVTTTSGLAWKIPRSRWRFADLGRRPLRRQRRRRRRIDGAWARRISTTCRRISSSRACDVACTRRTRAWKRSIASARTPLESRLLNARGLPNFNIRFFILNKRGEHAGVAMYGSGEKTFALCTEKGAGGADARAAAAREPDGLTVVETARSDERHAALVSERRPLPSSGCCMPADGSPTAWR
jgi:N4-(beta-N-acetylglucosaminyl)-L-asparaginase